MDPVAGTGTRCFFERAAAANRRPLSAPPLEKRFAAEPRPTISFIQYLLVLIAEPVVHADQGSSRSRLGIEGTTNRANNGVEHEMIFIAEVREVAFQKG